MHCKVVVLQLFLLAFAVCCAKAQTLPGSDLFVAEKSPENNLPTPQTQWNYMKVPSKMCIRQNWKVVPYQGQYYNFVRAYEIVPCPQ